MPSPRASVLIPTLNPGPSIEAVLSAIYRQAVDFDFEVVVVDSGSGAADLERLRRFPLRLLQIAPGEFNHGRTRNLLAREAQGELLLFLSQDAQPADSGWMARLIAPLADSGVAGSYARQLPRPNADPFIRYFLEQTYGPQPARRRLVGEYPAAIRPRPSVATKTALPNASDSCHEPSPAPVGEGGVRAHSPSPPSPAPVGEDRVKAHPPSAPSLTAVGEDTLRAHPPSAPSPAAVGEDTVRAHPPSAPSPAAVGEDRVRAHPPSPGLWSWLPTDHSALGTRSPAPGTVAIRRSSVLPFSNVSSALRRDAWERVPFREDVVMSEDQYWAYDALHAGYDIVYEPAACVYHSHNYSLPALFRRNRLSGASLRGLIEVSPGGIAGHLGYLSGEIRHLLSEGAPHRLPDMFLYEATRTAGFAAGLRFGAK